MNLNLSGSLNIFKLLAKPSLCLPHATVSTFNDLPIPLDKAFEKRWKKPSIKAVVLDKDDCFAYPDTSEIHAPYKVCSSFVLVDPELTPLQERFAALRAAYPGRQLLIVSNTAGALSYDASRKLAKEVEGATGVTVLSHSSKKPGCGNEIMEYFKSHPEAGVTHPSQIAVVGDRLTTDMMLANMMGSWGIWVKDGVVPLQQKSIVSHSIYTTALCIDTTNSSDSLQGLSRNLRHILSPEAILRQNHPIPSSEDRLNTSSLSPETTLDQGSN